MMYKFLFILLWIFTYLIGLVFYPLYYLVYALNPKNSYRICLQLQQQLIEILKNL